MSTHLEDSFKTGTKQSNLFGNLAPQIGVGTGKRGGRPYHPEKAVTPDPGTASAGCTNAQGHQGCQRLGTERSLDNAGENTCGEDL